MRSFYVGFFVGGMFTFFIMLLVFAAEEGVKNDQSVEREDTPYCPQYGYFIWNECEEISND